MLQLIGGVVKELWVSKGEEVLKFVMADGTNHYYKTDADCCSETWFADIVGVKAIIGGKVTKATSMDGEALVQKGSSIGVEHTRKSTQGGGLHLVC